MNTKKEKTQISKKHQKLVIERIEKSKENPERLLNWDEVSENL